MDIQFDHSEVKDFSLAHIAIYYPAARFVFNRYELDFCCDGHQLLSEACADIDVLPDFVWNEILQMERQGVSEVLHVDTWSFTFLLDFIVQNHHQYASTVIPRIKELLYAVCDKSGEDHMTLVEIVDDFNDLAEMVLDRMQREEQLLFPSLRRVHKHRIESSNPQALQDEMEKSGKDMLEEHREAGDLLRSIRKLTNYYQPPADACPDYKRVYQNLANLDADLTMHMFLENNFLLKKVGIKSLP